MFRWPSRPTRTSWVLALLAASVVFPSLAGAATVLLAVVGWPSGGAVKFAIGIGFGTVATVALAAACRRYGHVDRSNPTVYGQLVSFLNVLAGRLEESAGTPLLIPVTQARLNEQIALVEGELGTRTPTGIGPKENESAVGLRYLLASGYVTLWRRLYRIDESLLEAISEPRLIEQALIDELRLEGSSIRNAEELLDRLRHAVVEIDPTAARYLLKPPRQPTAGAPGTAQPPAAVPPSIAAGPADHREARLVLRSIRRVINEFRADARDGIVRARNRLFATVFFAGLTAFAILGLALACGANATEICAGSAFYLVGAVIGLFRLLHSAGQAETVREEDYALSTARLLQTPLLSGIAGVGGVVITALATKLTPGGTVPTLSKIFDLGAQPYELLLAAVFGFTPTLLISRLQGEAEKSKEDLQGSQSGGGSAKSQ